VVAVILVAALGLSFAAWKVRDRVHPDRFPPKQPRLHAVKRAIYTVLPIWGLILALPPFLDAYSEEVWTTGRVVDIALMTSDSSFIAVDLQTGDDRIQVAVPEEVLAQLEPGDTVQIAMSPRVYRAREVTILEGAHRGYHLERRLLSDYAFAPLVLIGVPFVMVFWGAFMMELAIPGLAELSRAWWRRAQKART
jgi:hypothetical protein